MTFSPLIGHHRPNYFTLIRMSPPQSYEDDLAFSKALHDHETESGSLLAKITSKDKEAFGTVVTNYMGYWVDKDPMTESEEIKEARRSNYTNMTNSYYNIATDFYEVLYE